MFTFSFKENLDGVVVVPADAEGGVAVVAVGGVIGDPRVPGM